MSVFTSYDTQRLTRTPLEIVAGRRRWRAWLRVALIFALAIVVAAAISQGVGPFEMINLQRENARLRADLERTRLELDMEHATRAELERHNQALGEQVTQLNQQLEFVNSHARGQTTTIPPPRPVADHPEG